MGGIAVACCTVQRLTDYVWVPFQSTHDGGHCRRIARILYALRESLELLDSWYEKLDVAPDDFQLVFHLRFWPSPNAYKEQGTNTLVRFTYQGPLDRDYTCVTYLAKTHDYKDIVVKFVTSYGAEAHAHMASEGFAPRLLYYGEINVSPDMPSYGESRMVVMEHVKGWASHDPSKFKEIPSSFKSDLERAIKHPRDGGYV